MASSDILSQTLSSITAIKLEELSNQRTNFEDGKSKILQAVDNESDQKEKVRILLSRIETLSSMSDLDANNHMSLKNIKQFLEQADCDPSVSLGLQKDWEIKLEKALDTHSLKYEYAALYGRLVNEWLSASKGEGEGSSIENSAFEKVGRKEMHDQRATWEEYVFKPLNTDTVAIESYLKTLFRSSKPIDAAYEALRAHTRTFEVEMATGTHFNEDSLEWIIKGLLRSDLITDEKRKVLQDFQNNKVVLAEVADVLNMRMKTLHKWHWDPQGTPVEQRRQLNGRYRFYHDEDLLQTMLLRYIGVKWSVHFKESLTRFSKASEVWKSSSASLSPTDKRHRENFLGPLHTNYSVEAHRTKHFEEDIFLEQLSAEVDENRGGYGDDGERETDTRKSGQQITQKLLHTLATEIIVKSRLGENPVVVRSDFKWFGPSLPHSTMFAALKTFGVSNQWLDFFRRVLEAPMKFVQDGLDAPVQIRKRGTPISGPMSDMLAETMLFCLDFSFNQRTDGARLYRLHDDIWFWGNEKTCEKGWAVMTEFAKLMGLEFNEKKTGSVKISRTPGNRGQVSGKLPKGDVRWGFLKLDSESGRFLINQDDVDTHINELGRQLVACKSVFDWIQAWNVYGARFFAANFGKPANCYGQAHVDMILDAFARIQSKLFASTGGSVTSTLKQMLMERFGVQDVPEGYLYFPMSMGGLDLKNPFVNLYLIRNTISKRPDEHMDKFFRDEETAYRVAAIRFDKADISNNGTVTPSFAPPGFGPPPGFNRPSPITANRFAGLRGKFRDKKFMSFEEFTQYREQYSQILHNTYSDLVAEPNETSVTLTSDVAAVLAEADNGRNSWRKLSTYQQWIIQLYAPDMISRFGGLNIVEKGLLPTGMVSMFRESRFKWQG